MKKGTVFSLLLFIAVSVSGQTAELALQTGHVGGIQVSAVSHSGSLIATGGTDNIIVLWDQATARQLARLEGHIGGITTLAFDRADSLLLSGSGVGEVKVWNIRTGKNIYSYKLRNEYGISPKNTIKYGVGLDYDVANTVVGFSYDGPAFKTHLIRIGDKIESVYVEGQKPPSQGAFQKILTGKTIEPLVLKMSRKISNDSTYRYTVKISRSLKIVEEAAVSLASVRRLAFSDNNKEIYVQANFLKIMETETGRLLHEYKQVADFNLLDDKMYCAVIVGKSMHLFKYTFTGDSLSNTYTEPIKKIFKNINIKAGGVAVSNYLFSQIFDYSTFHICVKNDSLAAYTYRSSVLWCYAGRRPKRRIAAYVNIAFNRVLGLAITADDAVVLCTEGNPMYAWNARNGRQVAKLNYDSPLGLAAPAYVLQTGEIFVASGNMGFLYHIQRRESRPLQGVLEPNTRLTLYPDNKLLFIKSADEKIREFDYSKIPFFIDYFEKTSYYAPLTENKIIRFTDRNRVIISEKDKILHKSKIVKSHDAMDFINWVIMPLFTLDFRRSLVYDRTYKRKLNILAHDYKNNLIYYTGGETKKIRVVNTEANKRVAVFKDHRAVSAMFIANGGEYLYTEGNSNTYNELDGKAIYVWKTIDLISGKKAEHKTIYTQVNYGISALAVSGRYIALADARHQTTADKFYSAEEEIPYSAVKPVEVRLLDTGTGEVKQVFKSARGPLLFLNNGKKLCYTRGNDIMVATLQADSFANTGRLAGHTNSVESITFDSVGNYLVSSSLDGTLRFWNIDSNKLIATLLFFNKSYIIFLPDGYYMSSRYGTDAIGYKVGDKFATFEQFDFYYNRPDKVMQALGWGSADEWEVLRQSHTRHLKRMGLDSLQQPDFAALPELKVTNRSEILPLTKQSFIWLKIKSKSAKNALKNITVEINEIPVFGSSGIALRVGSLSFSDSIKVALNEGENQLRVYATTVDGYQSLRELINITYIPEKKKEAKTWVVAIGISKYADTAMNLNYAAKDAQDLATWFSKSNKNAQVLLYTNENATRQNLLKIKEILQQSNVEDKVILSYSSHGVLDENKEYYLATHDINFKKPSENGLLYSELMGLLDSIPARKKLVFIDACHSGELDVETIKQVKIESNVQGEVTASLPKGADLIIDESLPRAGLKTSFELMQELFANIEKGNGAVIISAAAGVQLAFEGREWNNGLFTYCILQGLKEKKADKNKDGHVSVNELKEYISTEVTTLSKGRQTPTFRSENYNFDWNLR